MRHPSRFNTPELLAGLRKRDHRAWEAFYEEQWDPLCRFIQTRFSNSSNAYIDCEDLAQEVFCRAYTGISHFRGEACVETWLTSIAQHVLIDTVRMLSVRHALSDGSVAHEGVREALHARSTPDPETATVRKDAGRKLLQELTKVLGKYSGPFIKRYLADMSEQEVAEAEHLKRGTASDYLSRARHLLSQECARFTSFL
jgi:RNA polymerase sigma factor (sigma-70 family)